MIPENTKRSNPKDDVTFLQGENTKNPDDSTVLVVGIGAAVIAIGAAIYIGKLLHKKRSKRKKDLEDDRTEVIPTVEMEPLPKKTAADHLEEIKEKTQKVLQPLKLGTSSSLVLSESRGSSPSSSSSKFQAERSLDASRIGTSRNPLLQSKTPPLPLPSPSPPPPPPSPLKFRYEEDFEIDPIRLSLLDALLLDSLTPTQTPPSLNTSFRSSRSTSIANSRTLSQHISLPQLSLSSQPSRDHLNPKRSKQKLTKYIISNDENNYANSQRIQHIEDIKAIQSERITPAETEVHSSNSS